MVTVAQHVGGQPVRNAVRAGLRVVVVVCTGSDFRLQVADVGRSIAVLASATVVAAALLVPHLVMVVGDEVRRWQFPFATPHEDAHENDDQHDNGHGESDAHDDYQGGGDRLCMKRVMDE